MSEATDVEEPKPAETSEVVEAAPVPSELASGFHPGRIF